MYHHTCLYFCARCMPMYVHCSMNNVPCGAYLGTTRELVSFLLGLWCFWELNHRVSKLSYAMKVEATKHLERWVVTVDDLRTLLSVEVVLQVANATHLVAPRIAKIKNVCDATARSGMTREKINLVWLWSWNKENLLDSGQENKSEARSYAMELGKEPWVMWGKRQMFWKKKKRESKTF